MTEGMLFVLNFFAEIPLTAVVAQPPPFMSGEFWQREVLPGFLLWRVTLSLVVVAASLLFKNALQVLFARILVRAVNKKGVIYEDLILQAAREPFGAFILLFGFELATQILMGGLERFRIAHALITTTYEVALGVILIWTFYRLVDVGAVFFENIVLAHDASLRPQLTPLFRNTLRVTVLVVGILTLLATFHVNVISLLAGLGVGGIAVALALQDPLGNFFGSITLIADRSFRVGDWIQMGASLNRVDGIVEEIGFRSTRLRTFGRTLLTIPNNLICKDIIENFSAMPKRRVRQTFAVGFQTGPEQIRAFVQAAREAVQIASGVEAEGSYFYFHEITANGYEILINYFTIPVDLTHHLEIKERINYRLMELAREHRLTLMTAGAVTTLPLIP